MTQHKMRQDCDTKVARYIRYGNPDTMTLHDKSTEHKWALQKVFSDIGKSGTSTENRPAFAEMIERCRNHEFDLIIVNSMSEFSRNTLDTIKYIRILKAELGIDIWFERENIDTRHNRDKGWLKDLFPTIYREEQQHGCYSSRPQQNPNYPAKI